MKGKPGEENRLSFEKFPYLGLSKTYSWDQQTSDFGADHDRHGHGLQDARGHALGRPHHFPR